MSHANPPQQGGESEPISELKDLRKLVSKCFYDELMEVDHDEWDEDSIEFFDTKEVITKVVTLIQQKEAEGRIAVYRQVLDNRHHSSFKKYLIELYNNDLIDLAKLNSNTTKEDK